MARLEYNKLPRINKTGKDLVQLLSPGIEAQNQQLFFKTSGNMEKFRNQLKSKGIELVGDEYPDLEKNLNTAREKIKELIKKNSSSRKTRLDLDISKIIHENLNIPRRIINDYDFWRTLNLFYFIDITKWRWEKDPSNPSNWNHNSIAIFRRATGYTLKTKKWEEEKIIKYDIRQQRIDIYRYWTIADKLYDKSCGYKYLDKIAKKYKENDGPLLDFLGQLEGSKLLSKDNNIPKYMAQSILLGSKEYTQADMRSCFKRYNAFTNRLLMNADLTMIEKEICSQ